MMNISTQIVITDVYGKPVPNGDHGDMTFAAAVADALLIPNETDDAQTKVRCWQLAGLIVDTENVELSRSQVTMILDYVGKRFGPVIVGPIFRLLDGVEE